MRRLLILLAVLLPTKGDKCSENCRPAPSGKTFCLTSGECAEGCIRGFFGKPCKLQCNQNCLGEICAFNDGTCTRGCKRNFCGHKCSRFCGSDSTLTPTTQKYTTQKKITALASTVSHKPTLPGTTESYEEGTSFSEVPKVSSTIYPGTDTALVSTPGTTEGGMSKYSKILLYFGKGLAVLLVNVAIICFLYVCLRRNLNRTNSRIEATHASIRVIELACRPLTTPEIAEGQEEQPTPSTSYLTATPDTAVKGRVVSTHEYDVIDSNDLEPVMLLADCFDDFVTNSATDPSALDFSGGKYLTPISNV